MYLHAYYEIVFINTKLLASKLKHPITGSTGVSIRRIENIFQAMAISKSPINSHRNKSNLMKLVYY